MNELHDLSDDALIAQAVRGDRSALRALVERHQPFVFNVALKMFGSRADAEDVSQEVFIRVLTNLGSFRGESSFTTWLYRVTVNHFLKTKRRGMEVGLDGFEAYFNAVATMPDEAWSPRADPDSTVEELRVRCTTGMLMCLDREQRIIFILGSMLGVPNPLAAEALGLTPGNFRVRLHRARADLSSWMGRRCGLVNKANPCRCEKKTRAFVKQGLVDPDNLQFTADHLVAAKHASAAKASEVLASVEAMHEREFQTHPEQQSRVNVLDSLFANDTLRSFFRLDA